MQIEEGKYYRTEDGEKAGPAEFQDERPNYPSYWKLPVPSYPAGLGYDDDGKFRGARSLYPGKDLVTEWEEPAVVAPDPATDPVKHMVERFLSWRLPKDFKPDGGISFEPLGNKGTAYEYRSNPTGTNLFDASQAEAMVRYMTAGLDFAASVCDVSCDLASMTDRAVKAEAERDKWHRKAMDAGVIVHTDGSTSHPMRQERDELRKAFSEQADEYLAETDRLRGYIKAHCEHETKLAAQIDAMTETARIYRAECDRLKRREAELLEANNGYLERARRAETEAEIAAQRATYQRPKLRDCPMCGADGENDEKVAFIAHEHVCNGGSYAMGFEVRCVECGVSVSDEYESEALRLWNGKQNAEQCTACGEYLDEGDLVYIECGEGGFLHADCCDKSDVTGFTDEDGNPLQPGDKIPEPFAWKGGAA